MIYFLPIIGQLGKLAAKLAEFRYSKFICLRYGAARGDWQRREERANKMRNFDISSGDVWALDCWFDGRFAGGSAAGSSGDRVIYSGLPQL